MASYHRDTYALRGQTSMKMNDEVYKLRRRVINIIYEAKKLVHSLPRINVRITETKEPWNGIGGHETINITQYGIKQNDSNLRRTVLHEIAHAVFGTPHVDQCPLMHHRSGDVPFTKAQLEKLFVKYARG